MLLCGLDETSARGTDLAGCEVMSCRAWRATSVLERASVVDLYNRQELSLLQSELVDKCCVLAPSKQARVRLHDKQCSLGAERVKPARCVCARDPRQPRSA